MNAKKVKAFTLSELLVVLVISSIVIAITFTALNLVQKQVYSIKKNLKNRQEILFLKRILLQDLNTHKAFYKQHREELLLFNVRDTLLYQFNNNYIVRKKDTFHVSILKKTFLMDGKIIKDGWTDAINLKFNQPTVFKELFVFKTSDATHYLNR